ncbi:hypothetical protein [Endozoicomonas sp. ALB032]|uniref:hypothetical protein n=1 Tax=Endozoicomonas sp. ALB032 TaxID=3403082 RepID=UPI003BB6378B
MTERYFIPAQGADLQALKTVLATAIKLAEENKSAIVLVVPALKYIQGSILNRVVNETSLKGMVKGKTVRFHGVTMRMVSRQTFSPHRNDKVLLALWGGENLLHKVDEAKSAVAVVAISWIKSDIERWALKHNAKELTTLVI